MNFKPFAAAIAAHFAQMANKGELYRVDLSGDDLWQAYLASFPDGTNPIFRVRTHHDGSYDKNFVRRVGNIVSISKSGKVTTLWDAPGLEYPYSEVAETLRQMVLARPVCNLFRVKEDKFGYLETFEKTDDGVITWNHFHCTVPNQFRCASPAEKEGEAKTTIAVMERGFMELTPDSVSTVLDLIEAGQLYRGDEFQANLAMFQKAQNEYLNLNLSLNSEKAKFLWSNSKLPVARLRNTAIGTLLQDLSEGMDLEVAVKRYDRMMAPTNYKRPTALITKGMVDKATKTIADLGLESALARRFAKITDISVNNVLWVNGKAQSRMKGGSISDLLMDEVKAKPVSDLKATPVDIEKFMQDILPTALDLELFFGNQLQPNLVSLTAPAEEVVTPIFKWDNNFAWSYTGNITDSIKERVKAAGGNTNAKLRVSLAWFNFDDLDIHADCPEGHVYFGAKGGNSFGRYDKNGQILDVDMNAGGRNSRTPVENLSWKDPQDGRYRIGVHQYNRRETENPGFTIELENDGQVRQFSYHKAVKEMVHVLDMDVKNGKVVKLKVVDSDVIGQGISQDVWGLSTEKFVKVETVMLSPNYWDGKTTGNKHWIFVVQGCRNPDATRGIYNEFLRSDLEQHRKVFEVLGNKTKCHPDLDDQLSGLGFSSTKRDSVTVKVTDSQSTKVYQVNF